MKLESSEAWRLLIESRLVGGNQLNDLADRIKGEKVAFDPPEALFDWLCLAKVLSAFQAKVLSTGLSGPLVFGEYVLSSQIDAGPLKGQFLGFHRPTGHPVLLEFYRPESETQGLADWLSLEKQVQRLVGIKSTALIPTYESVTVPDYAFVVSERPAGVMLAEKVPKKARLPWASALTVVQQVASAVLELHQVGMAHGAIDPRHVWLEGKLRTRLKFPISPDKDFHELDPISGESCHDYRAPELQEGQSPDPFSDMFSLGSLYTRLVTGRPLVAGDSVAQKREQLSVRLVVPDFSKFDVPSNLAGLIQSLLERDPQNRPAGFKEILQEFSRHLVREREDGGEEETPESLTRFLKHRATTDAFFIPPQAVESGNVNISNERTPRPVSKLAEPIGDIHEFQKRMHAQRRRSQWIRGITLLSVSLAIFSWIVWLVARARVESPPPSQDTALAQQTVNPADDSSGGTDGAGQPPAVGGVLHQFVRDDDGQMLWESPTVGAKFAFEWLPPNPRMILIFRPAELSNLEAAVLAMQGVPEGLQSSINQWKKEAGVEWTDVRQLVLALYPQTDSAYSLVSVVYLTQDVPRQRLCELWNATQSSEIPDLVSGTNFSYFLEKSPRSADNVSAFVTGPSELIKQAAEFNSVNSLEGSFRALADRVDANRHFSALVLPSALFNQQGQALTGDIWAPLNRQIRIFMDDHIQGILFSMHFEDGQCYWELTADHSADIKDQQLVDSLRQALARAQEMLVDTLATLPGDRYWNRIRVRLDNMFDGFVRDCRYGAEAGFVLVNNWVPDAAVHNLLKSTDLALRMQNMSPSTLPTTVSKVPPQSLEQLLTAKRDLKVTTNPDLNVLLQSLVSEVKESNPGMPFDFRIELMGNDLVGEGITQNQRPGDFELKETSLANILTEIVVRANPDKSASGPADPKCKLVWVIAEDAQKPGQKWIQITTRIGAESRKLELPSVFRVDN